ncbi:MAG: universal stress protein [Caldimicrobium sp.]
MALKNNGKICNIVLSTDGSEFSRGAEVIALDIAEKCNAKLHIINVIFYNPEYMSMAIQEVETQKSKAREILTRVKKEALEKNIEVNEDIVLAEEIEKGIVEAAEKYNADLIVMGRRGIRGLAKYFIGSATLGVLGLASCPILVAPRNSYFKGKEFLVGFDGSKTSLAALKLACEMTMRLNLPLSIITIAKDLTEKNKAEENLKRAEDFIKEAKCRIKDLILHIGDPANLILEVAKQRDVDLIVLGNRGLRGLAKMVLGSVSEKILSKTDRPVLIVKD